MFASTSTSGHTDLFLHIKEKQDGTGDSGKVGTLLNQTGVTVLGQALRAPVYTVPSQGSFLSGTV